MDFSFGEAQLAVSELTKKIVLERAGHAALRAVEAEADRFHAQLWGDLASTGLLATAIPEAHGGSGGGFVELAALLVELGAAVAPVPAWETLVLGALPIARFGSEAQQEAWLPKIAAGEAIHPAALVEPGARDPRDVQARATRTGDGWAIAGTKTCVPAAHLAARVIVPAETDAGVGLFLVDPRGPHATLERQVTTRLQIEGHLVLDGAPAEVLVVGEGGAAALAWLLDRALVGLCALEAGVIRRALEMTAQYTATRVQFERPIATFQAVAQRAADAFIDVESVTLAMWAAAWRLSEGLPADEAVAVAKITAAEAGHRVVAAAQHLHGGMGFDMDYPLYRHYVWSRWVELSLGGASTHLARLGELIAS